MSRGAKGMLLAMIGLAAVVGIISLAVVLSHGVEQGTIIQLTLSGVIAEERDTSLRGKVFQGPVTLTSELRELFETAAVDDNIDGMIVVLQNFTAAPGTIQELRDAAKTFRDSGKWSMAFMETAGEMYSGNWQYMLGSGFGDLTLAPAGGVNISGVLATVGFYRGIFDKIGVEPDFDHIGAYKAAKNIYPEKGFTEAHRESTTEFVGDMYEALVQAIADSREFSFEEATALVDRGPFTADEAAAEGLVDRLGYYDEFMAAAEEKAGGTLRTLNWGEYLDRRSGFLGGSHTVAVIHATGLIHRGESGYDPSIGMHAGSESVAGALRAAREDSSVEAIILRVNSPGGSPLASDTIWREVMLARESKPVIASFSDVAASGGYYIACGADRIVAEPATITGSIGVVYGKFVKKKLYDMIGLSHEQLQMGKNAHFWTDLKKWDEQQKEEIYWKFINQVYEQFVDRVAQGRKMTPEAVDRIGQGRVWTGKRAKELGLVDELGGFDVAVRLARELAQIPEGDGVRFRVLPEKPGWFESIWNDGEVKSVDLLPPSIRESLLLIQPLARASVMDGQPALVMPYMLDLGK